MSHSIPLAKLDPKSIYRCILSKLVIEERIHTIEVELVRLRKSVEIMPSLSDTPVDLDDVQSKVVEIVNNVFNTARDLKRACDRISN